jgi:hypothetical protein
VGFNAADLDDDDDNKLDYDILGASQLQVWPYYHKFRRCWTSAHQSRGNFVHLVSHML